jgi:small ligand-binding sensory domain FIST
VSTCCWHTDCGLTSAAAAAAAAAAATTATAAAAADAPPEEWAQLLGVDLHSSHPTNFIILAEPEFSKLTELTDGLDFAFPAANKIGALAPQHTTAAAAAAAALAV